MKSLLLNSVEHNLVYGLSEEALSESTNGILGIRFIQDLDVVSLLKTSKHLDNLFVGFMSERADVLQNFGAKDLPYYGS